MWFCVVIGLGEKFSFCVRHVQFLNSMPMQYYLISGKNGKPFGKEQFIALDTDIFLDLDGIGISAVSEFFNKWEFHDL